MVPVVKCSWLNGFRSVMVPQQDEAGFIDCDTSIPLCLLRDALISIHTMFCVLVMGTLEAGERYAGANYRLRVSHLVKEKKKSRRKVLGGLLRLDSSQSTSQLIILALRS